MHQIYLNILVNAHVMVLCSKPLTNFSLHRHTCTSFTEGPETCPLFLAMNLRHFNSPCPATSPSVPIEELVEQHEVLPMFVLRISFLVSVTWPSTVLVRQKDLGESIAELGAHSSQSHLISRAGGAFHFEFISEEIIVSLETFYQEVVH